MSRQLWPEVLKRRGLQSNSTAARFAVQGTLDALSWVVAALVTARLIDWSAEGPIVVYLTLIAVGAQWAIGWGLFLYQNRYPYGGFDEVRYVGLSALLVAACLEVAAAVSAWALDWAFPVVAMLGATVLMVFSRHLLRMLLDRRRRTVAGRRVLIVGAGEVGATLIRQMLHESDSDYLPVGLVDDDRAKRHLRIENVAVLGASDEARAVAAACGAEGVIVAIPRAGARLMRSLSDQLDGTGIWIRTVPPLEELVNGQVRISSIRDLNVEDLIGRQQVRIDLAAIRERIAGRRVLVTGAGGSIGSELCRQLHGLGPQELMMLDRDESALHALEMSIHGRALMDSKDVILADIRDPDALLQVFRDRRPQIVFHAAALKHLPMLEQYPQEGWKTNVHGTLNVLRAARAVGVVSFVNVSTDKAANPTSVLGRTKRVAERLTGAFAGSTGNGYLSVRFGNVLGSRGSVLTSFQEQINRGGPVTVTHPDVTRYFMTIPEACQLVLQAFVIGRSGETLVLDMGEPVRIVDIARRLMRLSRRSCEIVFTGLRDGEKLDEDLFGAAEHAVPGPHEKISHCRVSPVAPGRLPEAGALLASINTFYCAEEPAAVEPAAAGIPAAAGPPAAAGAPAARGWHAPTQHAPTQHAPTQHAPTQEAAR